MNGFLTLVTQNDRYLKDISSGHIYRFNEVVYKDKEDYSLEKSKLKASTAEFDWTIDKKYYDILDKIYDAHSMRREFRLDLYQTPALPESVLRRALQIEEQNKDVVLVGDDDLLCVPLALFGHNVTVLDIDDALIELIQKINNKLNLNILCYKCNLFDKVQMNSHFDYLYSDPVSTFEGFQVFIDKGISMLKEDGVGFISVNQRFLDLFYKYCEKSGIKCIETYKGFNNYYDSSYTVISDKADLHKIQIGDKNKLTFNLLDTVDLNIFESQKDMKLFCRVEIFDIQFINEEIKENLIFDIEKICQCKINSCEICVNSKFITILEDDNHLFQLQMGYENQKLNIEIEISFRFNIKRIRNTIATLFKDYDKFFLQYPSNYRCISNSIEMDTNCL